ncbi:hypothetical protein INR49_015291 [Caranx melampygus]|nr:hypothetical protein INR49_015291 [Caranx melampygus]
MMQSRLANSLNSDTQSESKWRHAIGSDKSLGDESFSLLTLCHILMSWDSNIFARLFFTLRAVSVRNGWFTLCAIDLSVQRVIDRIPFLNPTYQMSH